MTRGRIAAIRGVSVDLQVVIFGEILEYIVDSVVRGQGVHGDPFIGLRKRGPEHLFGEAGAFAVVRTDTSQIVLESAEFVRVVDEVLEALAHLCGPDDPAVALIECSRHLMEYEGDPPADLDERLDDRITGYLIDYSIATSFAPSIS